MKERNMTRAVVSKPRKIAMSACFVGLASLWAWTANEQRVLAREMQPHIQRCIEEFGEPGFDTEAELQVSREFVLAGTARARVEVFNFDTASEDTLPQMIQVFFVRERGGWVREGSGSCSDESCAIEAKTKHYALSTAPEGNE